jgi:carbamoyltransferase
MIILGIHSPIGLYGKSVHDSNITIIKDNTVLISSAEARFSRRKYDGSFPTRSIKNALKRFNIQPSDVDIITWTSAGKESAYWNNGDAEVFFKKLFKKAKLIYSGHHSSHAAASLLSSNFYNEDVNILTLDGSGDYYIEKDGSTNFTSSTFAIANQNLKKLDFVAISKGNESNQWDYESIGGFYLTVSGLIMICITGELSFPISYDSFYNVKNKFISENTNWGYILNGSPGKVMGLAAFGDNSKVTLPSPFTVFQTDQNSFPIIKRTYSIEEELLGINYLNYTFTPADLAAWLQKSFEDVIIEYLKKIPVQYKRRKLCFGGGCALNINLNSRIISEGLYENVHIHPAPSDEGLSFGSAMYYAWQNNVNVEPLTNIGCVGNEYFDSEVLEAFNKFSSDVIIDKQESLIDVCKVVAKELSNNKIVAWFQGKSEYGPRALGNR